MNRILMSVLDCSNQRSVFDFPDSNLTASRRLAAASCELGSRAVEIQRQHSINKLCRISHVTDRSCQFPTGIYFPSNGRLVRRAADEFIVGDKHQAANGSLMPNKAGGRCAGFRVPTVHDRVIAPAGKLSAKRSGDPPPLYARKASRTSRALSSAVPESPRTHRRVGSGDPTSGLVVKWWSASSPTRAPAKFSTE